MTDAELVLLDFALERISLGQAFRIQGPLHNATVGMHEKYSGEMLNEIINIVIYRPDAIRNLLLAEGYTKCEDHATHLDILTDRGKKAKELGGHLQYKEWEAKEKKSLRIENIPKKYWYFYEPAKTIINWLIAAALVGVGVTIGRLTAPQNNIPIKNSAETTTAVLKPANTQPKKDSVSHIKSPH
jgi:hypothetical protein